MSKTNEFERRAAAWLAEGPTVLRDPVLEDALREVHLTQQRRGLPAPWRFPRMSGISSTARAVLAAAVLLLAIGGGSYLLGGGGSTQSPTTAPGDPTAVAANPSDISPTPIPAGTPARSTTRPVDTSNWTTATSNLNGLSFGVPSGWQTQLATVPWVSTGSVTPWELDQVVSQRMAGFIAASHQVPAGLDASAWLASMPFRGSQCAPVGGGGIVGLTTVDGRAAYVHDAGWCISAAVLAGDRAYLLEMWAELEKVGRGSADAALFEAWLTTVRLDPAAADARVTPSAARP